ncbi:OmpA family protein [Roseovarius sp. S4756]|uniref:OmpA family protein n=1 Tax=Roseovarius maritimus TaxID=3342637 RepID=UPI003727428E
MRKTLSILPILALAGCAGGGTEVYRSYFTEAGAMVDGGNFGNANMQNTQVMTGERSYVYDLSNRFSKEVLTTVNFAFNSDQLDAVARDTLSKQAAWIRQFPEVRFKVYGHADLVGPNGYNKDLGMRRARAVVDYLTSHGISRSRLEAVVSFGEAQPLIVTQGRERRNRRTVTEVSGFVRSHPIIMDGKYAQVVYRETVASAVPEPEISMSGESSLGSE